MKNILIKIKIKPQNEKELLWFCINLDKFFLQFEYAYKLQVFNCLQIGCVHLIVYSKVYEHYRLIKITDRTLELRDREIACSAPITASTSGLL